MKIDRRIICFVSVLLVSMAVVILTREQKMEAADTAPETAAEERITGAVLPEPKLSCAYYIEREFKQSISSALPADTGGKLAAGGIVPHHLLADSLIAPFFKTLSLQDAEVVFLIGPNHKRAGRERIHTGRWDWQTPFGTLKADRDVAGRLVESCRAAEDFNLMEEDHSIAALVPYVKYYLPDARIVPILLHGNYGLEASKRLAREIQAAAGDESYIVIGSVDFSHYLPPDEADRKDEITLKAIADRDLEAISRMDNGHLDSPPSVITVLEAMNLEGAKELKVLGHSNSAKITGIHTDITTSYYTILFYK